MRHWSPQHHSYKVTHALYGNVGAKPQRQFHAQSAKALTSAAANGKVTEGRVHCGLLHTTTCSKQELWTLATKTTAILVWPLLHCTCTSAHTSPSCAALVVGHSTPIAINSASKVQTVAYAGNKLEGIPRPLTTGKATVLLWDILTLPLLVKQILKAVPCLCFILAHTCTRPAHTNGLHRHSAGTWCSLIDLRNQTTHLAIR